MEAMEGMAQREVSVLVTLVILNVAVEEEEATVATAPREEP
jgi:hypothetical protein